MMTLLLLWSCVKIIFEPHVVQTMPKYLSKKSELSTIVSPISPKSEKNGKPLTMGASTTWPPRFLFGVWRSILYQIKSYSKHNTAFRGIGSEAHTSPGKSSMWYSNKVVGSTPEHSSRYLWPLCFCWKVPQQGYHSNRNVGHRPSPYEEDLYWLGNNFYDLGLVPANNQILDRDCYKGVGFSTPWWVHNFSNSYQADDPHPPAGSTLLPCCVTVGKRTKWYCWYCRNPAPGQ